MLNSVHTNHLSEKTKDLEIDYSFTLADYILNTSGEIYINPHLVKELEDELIDVASTKEDIHYPYKSISSNVLSIEIPEEYSVSYLPENRSYEGNDFGFDLNYNKHHTTQYHPVWLLE